MDFQAKIEQGLFSRKHKSKFKAFHEIIFILGKELGWSPREVCDAPIPLVLGVLAELQEHYRREAKAAKKK